MNLSDKIDDRRGGLQKDNSAVLVKVADLLDWEKDARQAEADREKMAAKAEEFLGELRKAEAENERLQIHNNQLIPESERLRRLVELLTGEIDRVNAESKKLREALEFYADTRGYTDEGVKTDGAGFGWNHPDRGAHAREVLKETE